MAITKIWSVKSRLDTSLNYITNPEKTNVKPDIDAIEGVIQYIENKDKTEECKYVRAFNCSKDNAFDRMIQTQDSFGKRKRKNGVVAYHLVQSFKEFETTPEIAHQCGIELIEKLFADKYEVVLATHINHNHLHNHILINAVSFKDGKKYRRSFKDYFIDIRKTSDEICREHCLSVIEKPQHRGMHYAEWKALNEGKPTIRGQVREELDEIIKSSYTMQIFWKELKQRGYVVHRKGENIKYTSIIPPFGKRPIRLDKLGAKNLAAIIMALVKEDNKLQGKTSLKNLLKAEKPLCILQIKEADIKKFQAEAKKYGVLFTSVSDKTNDSGLCDIIAKQDDITKLNYIMEKLGYNAPIVDEQTAPDKDAADDKEKSKEANSKNSIPRANENRSEHKFTERGDMERTGSRTKPSVKKQIDDIKAQQKKKSRPDPERTPVHQDTRPIPTKKKKKSKER